MRHCQKEARSLTMYLQMLRRISPLTENQNAILRSDFAPMKRKWQPIFAQVHLKRCRIQTFELFLLCVSTNLKCLGPRQLEIYICSPNIGLFMICFSSFSNSMRSGYAPSRSCTLVILFISMNIGQVMNPSHLVYE